MCFNLFLQADLSFYVSGRNTVLMTSVYPTRRGAGSIEGRTGAGGVTGAAGLRLVEGTFQLPSPLDPTVLLAKVLEDLLWKNQAETKF